MTLPWHLEAAIVLEHWACWGMRMKLGELAKRINAELINCDPSKLDLDITSIKPLSSASPTELLFLAIIVTPNSFTRRKRLQLY